jgi:hypothetical protein
MRRVFAIPEAVLCASLVSAGAYVLKDALSSNSPNAAMLLIPGAVLLVFGLATLQAVVRSLVWHRLMLRRSGAYWRDLENHTTEHVSAVPPSAVLPSKPEMPQEKRSFAATAGRP